MRTRLVVLAPLMFAAVLLAFAPAPRAAEHAQVLTGRIHDDRGRPVPGVTVRLYGGFATRWEQQRAVSDAHGVYRFDALQSGSMIKDEATGRWDSYVGVTLEHPTLAPDDGRSWRDIRVPGEPGYGFVRDFTMTPGGSVAGVVSGADGKPAAGLGLRIYIPNRDGSAAEFLRYATTDGEGRFRETGLYAGRYVIDVNGNGYPKIGQMRVDAGGETAASLTAPPK
jgi:5-hydroxyisourate hydrolase-like protein (transthyretin family)